MLTTEKIVLEWKGTKTRVEHLVVFGMLDILYQNFVC